MSEQIGGRIAAGDARQVTGRARIAEIAEATRTEIATVAGGLVAGLGRPATAGEAVEAELIASAVVRARRKRLRGHCDATERREIGRLLRASIFRSAPERAREPATA